MSELARASACELLAGFEARAFSPTEALDGEARVDACRCLSYQTIENRGEVPEPLRIAFADLV